MKVEEYLKIANEAKDKWPIGLFDGWKNEDDHKVLKYLSEFTPSTVIVMLTIIEEARQLCTYVETSNDYLTRVVDMADDLATSIKEMETL